MYCSIPFEHMSILGVYYDFPLHLFNLWWSNHGNQHIQLLQCVGTIGLFFWCMYIFCNRLHEWIDYCVVQHGTNFIKLSCFSHLMWKFIILELFFGDTNMTVSLFIQVTTWWSQHCSWSCLSFPFLIWRFSCSTWNSRRVWL